MQKSLSRAALSTVIGIGYLGALTHGVASAETLIIQGSSTFNTHLMIPYKTDIEAAAGYNLSVVPTKSSLGLLALLEGKADLTMISASLESEVELLRETRPELPFHLLRSFLISRIRVAFAVNPSNPVRSATLAKVRRILQGDIKNWQELGGPDLPIHVVLVGGGGGVTRTIEVALFEGQRMTPHAPITVEFGSHVVKAVEQDRGALGLAQLAEVTRYRLPELRTDGYVGQNLYLVSLNEPTDAMSAVIAATRRVAFDESP